MVTQEHVISAIMMGYNIFITGAPGTGKSYTLNQCIHKLKDRGKSVAITASTGIAATHIDGRTIHSWSGINIYNETDLKKEMNKILNNRTIVRNVKDTDILIIDEISMLHAYQLEAINFICKTIKAYDAPFGGLQIILCGDFFQLPPVVKKHEKAVYVFDSHIWNNMQLKICYLKEQFRCRDSEFMNILTEIRNGCVSQKSKELLLTRINKPIANVKDPLQLFTINKDVDYINNQKLNKINHPVKKYYMKKSISNSENNDDKENQRILTALIKGCLAPEELILKKTAQVMFVRNNFSVGYVNGSLGEVVDFDKETDFPIVELASNGKRILVEPVEWKSEKVKLIKKSQDEIAFEKMMSAEKDDDSNDTSDDNEISKYKEITNGARIVQLPLKLAWAQTIHKGQGMSLDYAKMELGNVFVEGQGYVALSRVRSLEGISLLSLNEKAFRINSRIFIIDKYLQDASNNFLKELIPLVIKFNQDDQKTVNVISEKLEIKKENYENNEKSKHLMFTTIANAVTCMNCMEKTNFMISIENGGVVICLNCGTIASFEELEIFIKKYNCAE